MGGDSIWQGCFAQKSYKSVFPIFAVPLHFGQFDKTKKNVFWVNETSNILQPWKMQGQEAFWGWQKPPRVAWGGGGGLWAPWWAKERVTAPNCSRECLSNPSVFYFHCGKWGKVQEQNNSRLGCCSVAVAAAAVNHCGIQPANESALEGFSQQLQAGIQDIWKSWSEWLHFTTVFWCPLSCLWSTPQHGLYSAQCLLQWNMVTYVLRKHS